MRIWDLIRPVTLLVSSAILTINTVSLFDSTGGRLLVQKTLAEMEASLHTLAAEHITYNGLQAELTKQLLEDDRDWILIESLESIAESQGYVLSETLTTALDAARDEDFAWRRKAADCVQCAVDTRNCNLSVAMACGLVVELTPLGDITELARAGISFGNGEEIDKVDLGLSIVGLGATALTIASGGSSLSLKAGAGFMKFAYLAGRIPGPIMRSLNNAATKGIEWHKLSSVRSLDDLTNIVRIDKIRPMVDAVTALGTTVSKTNPRQGIYLLENSDNLVDFKRISAASQVLRDKTAGYLTLIGKSRVLRATLKLADEVYWLIGSFIAILWSIAQLFSSLFVQFIKRRGRRQCAPK